MAHIYRVVYVCNKGCGQMSVPVSATSSDNAVAAAKAADPAFKSVISVTQHAANIVAGS